MGEPTGPLSLSRKIGLVLRIWRTFLAVHIGLRRYPLPRLVERLGRAGRGRESLPPVHLGRIVWRVLRPVRPRCLISSLVLYRLVGVGDGRAQLAIGLPEHVRDKDAHAWVEIDGRDVGPPPGRGTHVPLARYG